MLDRVTAMQVFTRAATAGGLSAAARQLGLSSAMATKHVDALETQLGVKLFHRTTRRLTLTEAGRGYLAACQRILAELDEADAAAASYRLDANGTLRMNAPVSFGVRCIAPLLAEFSRQHPRVRVELGLNDRAIDMLDERWDLTIRIGRLASSRLTARKIANVDMVVCGAPAYLAVHGIPRKVEELAEHNCLGYSMSELAGPKTWVFGKDNSHHVTIRGNLFANNGDALAAAAIAGQGLVYVPMLIVCDALKAGTLVAIELDQPYCNLGDIFALYPPERRPPAKVRVMIDYLASAFAP
ncbi:LysR family transcriptional regulator [Pendulispora rubella]|uniref:LysR family transcriptional regulator n=1 Tax=Pendulispora rubella TaxID=2741070 RepID=A0ABZ2KQR6_9BACT